MSTKDEKKISTYETIFRLLNYDIFFLFFCKGLKVILFPKIVPTPLLSLSLSSEVRRFFITTCCFMSTERDHLGLKSNPYNCTIENIPEFIFVSLCICSNTRFKKRFRYRVTPHYNLCIYITIMYTWNALGNQICVLHSNNVVP